ncbi:MAG: TIGR00159 family protein [Victivallales bacterium]|nr:TIGR00159 family protein [Victivallales bacterium]
MNPHLIVVTEYAKTVFEIGLLAFLVYQALRFVRGTRAAMVLAGLGVTLAAMTILAEVFELEVIDWILSRLWTFLALSLLIIFHPEIRRAFAELGRQQSRLRIGRNARRSVDLVSTLVDATYYLADHRIGALIAVEQSIGMRSYTETGTYINAPVSSKLLSTIFFPNTPLHDGGVVIRANTLVAAGCIFPLTQGADQHRSLGTRHRAGVGISEETDAVVIIASEESGTVSLAYRGRLIRGVERERLRRHLTNWLVKPEIRKERGNVPLLSLEDTVMDFDTFSDEGGEG